MNYLEESASRSRVKLWIAVGNGCVSVVAAAIVAITNGTREDAFPMVRDPAAAREVMGLAAAEPENLSTKALEPRMIAGGTKAAGPNLIVRRPGAPEWDRRVARGKLVGKTIVLERPPGSGGTPAKADTLIMEFETLCPHAPEVAVSAPDSTKDKL